MTYLTWSADLSVGNAFIDHDHQKLIEMVNRLHELMQQGKGHDVIGKVLHNLAAYTREHFGREERLMLEMNYGDYAKHKAEHDRLLDDVSALVHRYTTGKGGLTIEVLQFLREWLVHHIGESDRELAHTAQVQYA